MKLTLSRARETSASKSTMLMSQALSKKREHTEFNTKTPNFQKVLLEKQLGSAQPVTNQLTFTTCFISTANTEREFTPC